jgi:hypothetical protein
MRGKLVLQLAAAALLLTACQSPEAQRTRGGGRGADLGYRGSSIEMHEGSEPYHNTPQLIDARHARGDADQKQKQASRR